MRDNVSKTGYIRFMFKATSQCRKYAFVNCFFFFKQKTAYEMRISDWSSDVCSSDLDANTGQSWILCRSSQQLVPRGSELEVPQIIVVCNDKAESGSVAQLQRGRRNEGECHSFVELLECGAGAVGDCLGAILLAGALVPWLEQNEGLTDILEIGRAN